MSFAYMKLYTGDYLRDTRHLTPQKHGIYLLLLMHCWDQKGPVPLDEQEIAGIANCRSADEIDALRYILKKYFSRLEDGWYLKRMQEEVAAAEHYAMCLSEAGKRSGKVRKARSVVRAKSRTGAAFEPGLNLGSTEVEPRSVTPTPTLSLNPKEKDTTLSAARTTESPKLTLTGEPETRRQAARVGPLPGFDRFWKAYPHYTGRSSRKDGAKLWLDLKLEPVADLVLAVLDEVKRADDFTREGGRFVPAAERWLKKQLWAQDTLGTTSSEHRAAELVEMGERVLAEEREKAEARRKVKAAA